MLLSFRMLTTLVAFATSALLCGPLSAQSIADRLTAEGYEATVIEAEGKTHLSIELEIGITGDIPTAEILKFIKRYTR